MDPDIFIILSVVLITVVFVLIFRLVGAWMLRINEVITEQKATNKALKEILDLLNKKQ